MSQFVTNTRAYVLTEWMMLGAQWEVRVAPGSRPSRPPSLRSIPEGAARDVLADEVQVDQKLLMPSGSLVVAAWIHVSHSQESQLSGQLERAWLARSTRLFAKLPQPVDLSRIVRLSQQTGHLVLTYEPDYVDGPVNPALPLRSMDLPLLSAAEFLRGVKGGLPVVGILDLGEPGDPELGISVAGVSYAKLSVPVWARLL
ncbi:MAG: hypothetical protein HY073_04305 [Deltaproteobacteria bacterium]|nr:hypothetical protein [Deltaproteobacteria bacterium]